MKYYCGNDRPFVFVSYPKNFEQESVNTLQELEDDGVIFWYADNFSKKELKHIEASFGVLLFVSKDNYYSPDFRSIVDAAIHCNKNILTIYLEDIGKLDSWGMMQLNSAYSLMKYSFNKSNEYIKKVKEAAIFRDMAVTPEQKKFQKTRGITFVTAPILAAIIIFLAIINPLLIAPAQSDDDPFHIKGITQSELDAITSLWVVGDTVYTDPSITKVHSWTDNSGKIFTEIDYNDGRSERIEGTKAGNVSDISDLAKLKNLERLGIQGQNITDISPILKLDKLIYLGIECNPISSIEGISSLTNLEQLFISDTSISDITPIIGLNHLNNLCADDAPISYFPSDIFSTTRLDSLCISGNSYHNISQINFPSNRTMSLDINNVSLDYSCLSNIDSFNRLRIGSSNITNINQSIGNTPIMELVIEAQALQNLNPLVGLNITQRLVLNECEHLTDISDITSFPNISELSLYMTIYVSDYSPLLKMENLKNLYLSSSVREIAQEQLAEANFTIVFVD